jgi:hypothetical protein
LATPTIVVKTDKETDGTDVFEISAIVAGMPRASSTERMLLNWSIWEKTDFLLGNYLGKMGWSTMTRVGEEMDSAAQEFLRNDGGWSADDSEMCVRLLTHSTKKDGWMSEHVWGFELVDNGRRYTRRVAVQKDGKLETARLVYDYLGQA